MFELFEIPEFIEWIDNKVVKRSITIIQNHHTYSPSYKHFKGSNHQALLKGMEAYHINNNGWSAIAQNFTTFPDGKIAVCRDIEKIPAGIKGANKNGICIEHIGNFDTGNDEMTAQQKETIIAINAILCRKFNLEISTGNIVYHHWYDLITGKRMNGEGVTKSCPGTAFFGGNKVSDAEASFTPLVKEKYDSLFNRQNVKINKGYSLHIGLNYVDPSHYSGWKGELDACVNDAQAFALIAHSMNYDSVELVLNQDATREIIIDRIKAASKTLETGDTFLITYAGHGGQIPDLDGDEDDAKDETWCLFNGQLIDDELHQLWTLFREGVRIWIITDSCHSGTLIRGNMAMVDTMIMVQRSMPRKVAVSTYNTNITFYDSLIENLRRSTVTTEIKATVRLFAACMDNQFASDGESNGLFTGTILKVWDKGNFAGNYRKFYKAIMECMPVEQSPQHRISGPVDKCWDEMKPFSLI